MISTTLLIGFLGILVWGHHMFVSGLNPFASSVFSISTLAIALPASAKVLSWLATVWRSRPTYTTAMLFSLGFVSLFITGGLTGPILAQPILDEYLYNTFFVVAHFHLIMAMAGIFALYAATYYWFPLITASLGRPARLMSEPLGRLHFFTTLIGAYAVFLPMHLTGLAGEPRQYAQLTGIPGPGGTLSPTGALLAHTLPLNHFITYAAIFLATAQLTFLFNLARSLFRGTPAPPNPWHATTLEWHPSLNPFAPFQASDEQITVYRVPCQYSSTPGGETFIPQWAHDSAANPKPE
jgi:cytochrome c oxidase subunit 1